MSSTMTQILSFAIKEAANVEELANGANNGPKGLQRQFLGCGVEEPQARLWFLEWEAGIKSKSADLEKALHALASEAIQNIHIAFSESPRSCIMAPVTEFIFSTMKPEQDLITFSEICNVKLRATAEQPGCLGTSWGYTKENPKAVVLLVGWERVDAHKKFTKTEVFKICSLPYIQGVTESKVAHYKFQQM